ncbi:MAG: DUF1080 domain-containing protein [Gemmataceae bacterium]|nr:DUF1080 domain-containing protein [Gemmataceae bacterium]
MTIRVCIGLCLLVSSAAAAEPVRLFNGKDLTGWKLHGDTNRNRWQVGRSSLDPKNPAKMLLEPSSSEGELVNTDNSGINIATEAEFGDCILEIEVMVPKGSNSGIYLMGEYEVQVLDSYGKRELTYGDMGGIYNYAPPRQNAAKKPGEWQKFVIEFRAPRFGDDGQRQQQARFVKVTLNGQVIHENVELRGPTAGGLTGREKPRGPLMLQGDHGPVAYRHIVVRPLDH